MAGCRWSQAQPCGSRRNQVLRSCGERRNSCSTGEQDKEGQITLLVIKEWPSGRSFLCFGLSFSLQNHINLLFIQHFPCRYAFISKTLRNFAVVNISTV